MIPLLSEHDDFPDPSNAYQYHDGLICVSQTITPSQILKAYRKGIFPWYQDESFYYWFSIAPRAILLPEHLYVTRSLKKAMKNQKYQISINHDFERVIQSCATITRPDQAGTWISPAFQAAYTHLHHIAHAHSFEYWNEHNQIVGGFYGVQIGSVFFGESMFAYESNASKIAFAHAVPFLADCGVRLIDCQQDTDYLKSFGSQTVSMPDFQAALQHFTAIPLRHALIPKIIINNQ